MIKRHFWKIILINIGIVLNLVVIFQVFYPADYLVLFTKIDGVDLSGWRKDLAVDKLNESYSTISLPIYFGEDKVAYRSPKPSEIGLTVDNQSRVNNMNYPWYLRIIPSSILWMHYLNSDEVKPEYKRDEAVLSTYITKELGDSCSVKPVDANLKVVDGKITVIESKNGGTCDIDLVKTTLQNIQPVFGIDNNTMIPVLVVLPTIYDELASNFGNELTTKISDGVNIDVAGQTIKIAANEILGWADFSNSDGKLGYSFNTDRASVYLNKEIAPKVAISAGVTKVSTYDFVETSRVNGAIGRALNNSETLENIKLYLDGSAVKLSVATSPIYPRVDYSRSYSPTDAGLSALIEQYADDHTGVYGVSVVELSGQYRRASYNGSKIFTPASTYKLFVAYSVLKRVEDGIWKWTDGVVSGKNLSTCFDDMIVRSDNPCAETLLEKVGYRNITNEMHAIGLNKTSFVGNNGIETTSDDLALLLAQLESDQILNNQSSRDLLINAMKRNIYRNGIPAGVNSGTVVADKVGFLYGLLHDASIVYSPTGTYILVVLTDGSSWATIADFTRQIEMLRA